MMILKLILAFTLAFTIIFFLIFFYLLFRGIFILKELLLYLKNNYFDSYKDIITIIKVNPLKKFLEGTHINEVKEYLEGLKKLTKLLSREICYDNHISYLQKKFKRTYLLALMMATIWTMYIIYIFMLISSGI